MAKKRGPNLGDERENVAFNRCAFSGDGFVDFPVLEEDTFFEYGLQEKLESFTLSNKPDIPNNIIIFEYTFST